MLEKLPVPVLGVLLELLDYDTLMAVTEIVPLAAELVTNARHLYTGKPVYKLNCSTFRGATMVTIWSKRCCGRFSCKSTKVLTVCRHEFARFMHELTPKHLEFEDTDVYDNLNQTWWDRIKNITIKSAFSNVTRWSGIVRNCNRLTIVYTGELKANDWLKSMRSIESFCFESLKGSGIQFDDNCLDLLMEKSQKGLGLMKITAQCDGNVRVSPQKLAQFFAEGKFGRPQMSFGILSVEGTEIMLKEQLSARKLAFISLTHPFYVVERSDCIILAKLHFSG